ncbi:MAG: HDOD domain-containing protein [Syntrophobacteraceae bacterium]
MNIAPLDEKEIRYRVSQIKDLPVLSPGLLKILDILAKQTDSANELESLIRYDPGLAAKVMRTANSTYYGFRGEICSLSQTIDIVGYERVKSICLCSLLSNDSAGESLHADERECLWKHSLVVAGVASLIALKRPWVSREDAYLLGLLHDFGRIIVAVNYRDHYRLIHELARKRKVPSWNVEHHFGLSHTLIGKWISMRWAFPLPLQAVIEFHHEPECSPSFKPEIHLVALANILANSEDYPEYLDDDCTRIYCNELYISVEEWNGYRRCLGKIRAEVDQFWNLLK